MLMMSLFAVAFLILPLASSISLFASEQSQRRRSDASDSDVNYGWALTLALLMTAVIGVVLYFVLFSTVPAVHDAAHQLRHGMAVIPCH